MNIKTLIAIFCLFVTATASQTVNAQTLNLGDAVEIWAQNCGDDVKKHCKGVRPGANRLGRCLQAKASTQCRRATAAFLLNMDARFAAQAKAPELCKASVKRLCSNYNAGQARILRCLMRPVNFKKANASCKTALINAGWLDEISIRSK